MIKCLNIKILEIHYLPALPTGRQAIASLELIIKQRAGNYFIFKFLSPWGGFGRWGIWDFGFGAWFLIRSSRD